jgi:hypothetical protein
MSIIRVDSKATFKVISQYDSALINESDAEMEQLKKDGKQTRYEDYLDSLDESKLQMKEGDKPTYFVIRCLKNTELAEIHQKHMVVDPVAKTTQARNAGLMMLEHFKMGCLGIQNEDGTIQKLDADDVGFGVALSIGTTVSMFTSLGKNLKNA